MLKEKEGKKREVKQDQIYGCLFNRAVLLHYARRNINRRSDMERVSITQGFLVCSMTGETMWKRIGSSCLPFPLYCHSFPFYFLSFLSFTVVSSPRFSSLSLFGGLSRCSFVCACHSRNLLPDSQSCCSFSLCRLRFNSEVLWA